MNLVGVGWVRFGLDWNEDYTKKTPIYLDVM